jgi:hypothetical protein
MVRGRRARLATASGWQGRWSIRGGTMPICMSGRRWRLIGLGGRSSGDDRGTDNRRGQVGLPILLPGRRSQSHRLRQVALCPAAGIQNHAHDRKDGRRCQDD